MIKSSNLLIFYFNRRACQAYTKLMLSYLGSENYKLFSLKENKAKFERIDNTLYIPNCRLGLILYAPIALILSFFKLLKNRIRSQRNLVYLPSFHPYNSLICLVAKLLNYEIMLSIHDYETHLGEKSPITEKLQKLSILWASQCIFLSNNEYQKALNDGLDKGKSIITPHPLPDNTDRNTLEYNLPLKVLFLGRIVPYKGIHILQEAIEGLENVQLTIAGEGDWHIVDENRAKPRCIKKYISDQEWKELMLQHHILALPYLEASQSGIIGEALAMRIPLILSSIAGLQEQVSENAAIFFECNKPEGLKNQINNLDSDSYTLLKLKLDKEYEMRKSQFYTSMQKLKRAWGI